MWKHTTMVLATLLLMISTLAVSTGPAAAQSTESARPAAEVPFELLSAEIVRFDEPVHIGVGERALSYREALVLRLEVDRETYDSLPPSIEPFLYVGSAELRTFHIDRPQEGRRLVLTFHAPEWQRLREGAPMVLTLDHGAPARDPERYQNAPRFSRQQVTDWRDPEDS